MYSNHLNETVLLSTQTGFNRSQVDKKIIIKKKTQTIIWFFVIFQDQPFSVIMAELARTENVDCCHVMMVHRDKTLRPTDTPATIRLNTADIISKYTMHGFRWGTGGTDPPPPLENHKNIGFFSNTGLDPLKITKLPSQHSMLGLHWHTSKTLFCHFMAFCWRCSDGPLKLVFGFSLPSSTKKQNNNKKHQC